MSTKLTATQRKWISATENGLSNEQAQAVIAQRGEAMSNLSWRLK